MKILSIIMAMLASLGFIASLVGVVLTARDGYIPSLICFCITTVTCFVCFANTIEDIIK